MSTCKKIFMKYRSSLSLSVFQFRCYQMSLKPLRTRHISLEIPCCPLLGQESIFVPQPVKFLSEDLLCGNCTCHNYATYRDINQPSIILKDGVTLCHILIFIALSQRMVNTEMHHIFLMSKILPKYVRL